MFLYFFVSFGFACKQQLIARFEMLMEILGLYFPNIIFLHFYFSFIFALSLTKLFSCIKG